jgi:hypothetical protein
MEVDAAGDYAVVSLLGDGAVSVFPLRGEDGVGEASDVQQFVGIHQVWPSPSPSTLTLTLTLTLTITLTYNPNPNPHPNPHPKP